MSAGTPSDVQRSRVIIVDGGRWTVSEHPGCFGGPSEPSLLFSADGFMRRVRNYPSHWYELPARELLEVSWNR